MAINRAAIILIVCGVLAIAAILAATGAFLWLDRRRAHRIQQLTITSKGKDRDRDVDTVPEHVATSSAGPAPATSVASPEGAYRSKVQVQVQLAELDFPPITYPPRPNQAFSAYPTPPQSIQERKAEPSPPAIPRVSTKARKAPQSIPWGRQAAVSGPSSTGRPPRTSIRWQTDRDRDRPSSASARPVSVPVSADDDNPSSPPTMRTPTSARPSPLSPSPHRSRPSSTQTAATTTVDLHEFPLPPIPIVTADPHSAPPVLDTDPARRRASTLYEPREYARRSFVQGGSWQAPEREREGRERREPRVRRAATAPMDGFEALRLARKGSHLDIPLSAMGGAGFGGGIGSGIGGSGGGLDVARRMRTITREEEVRQEWARAAYAA